jgi:CBS domain-containing protein/gamma-glutamyl:cysteine ligase YbdK (ATP-grasp superfamily)
MGDKAVDREYDEGKMRAFTRAVLNDLHALELMLAEGHIEEDKRRIGAEQEMFLVDSSLHPSPIALEVIEDAADGRLTTEIGRFNLEANLTPRTFSENCLGAMEAELNQILDGVRQAAARYDSSVILAGILPTIQASDLTEKNLTPLPRYHEINRVVTELHGDDRHIHIKGIDEIHLTLRDTFTEFCNTSFQVHLQVGASEFGQMYNWSQAIAGPVLACSVNSPILLNHRLWHESRVALFQHATDTRGPVHRERGQPPRVNFGDRWVSGSIIEMLHEDAVRFRVLLTQHLEEDSLKMVHGGAVPHLKAWRLHNGTIWRWNRPCYGLVHGKPGLRIEARYLPSGPSAADEMANAALFLGLMTALSAEYGDVSRLLPFEAAKTNFFNAARYGLNCQTNWLDGKSIRTSRLLTEQLIPMARQGLKAAGVDGSDIDHYLGILEDRVKAEKTGAQWMLDSIMRMDKRAKLNVRMRSLAAAMKANQESGIPLHEWKLAQIPRQPEWIDNYRTVEQFMSTDLFTVRPEDVIDLAASLMHWKHVRHVPVENDSGELVGLISHRDLLELIALGTIDRCREVAAREIMQTNLITVEAETSALKALHLMRDHGIGCLPVVKEKRLVGLITSHDFLTVSTKLFEETLADLVKGTAMTKTNAR